MYLLLKDEVLEMTEMLNDKIPEYIEGLTDGVRELRRMAESEYN